MKRLVFVAVLAMALPAASWAAPNVNININGVLPPLPPAPPGVRIYTEGDRPYYMERDRRVYVQREDHRHRGWHKHKHRKEHHEDEGRGHAYGRHKGR